VVVEDFQLVIFINIHKIHTHHEFRSNLSIKVNKINKTNNNTEIHLQFVCCCSNAVSSCCYTVLVFVVARLVVVVARLVVVVVKLCCVVGSCHLLGIVYSFWCVFLVCLVLRTSSHFESVVIFAESFFLPSFSFFLQISLIFPTTAKFKCSLVEGKKREGMILV